VVCRLDGIQKTLSTASAAVRRNTRRLLDRRVGHVRSMVLTADRIGGGPKALRSLLKAHRELGAFIKQVRSGRRQGSVRPPVADPILRLAKEARERLGPLGVLR
jgi:hypothetical protein